MPVIAIGLDPITGTALFATAGVTVAALSVAIRALRRSSSTEDAEGTTEDVLPEQWEEWAHRLDLAPDPEGRLVLRGEIADLGIRLAARSGIEGEGVRRLQLEVHGIEPGLGLLEGPGTTAAIRTGDAAFDRCFRLTGDTDLALIVLDPRTRATLCEVLPELGGVVLKGTLRCEVPADERLVDLVQLVVGLVLRLREPQGSRVHVLASRFETEPDPQVQLRLIRLLSRSNQQAARAKTAFLAACGHSLPEVRLIGARHCGDQGTATLSALIADTELPTGVRVEALRALGSERDTSVSLVRACLTEEEPELVLAAIDTIAALDDRHSVPRLIELATEVTPDRWEVSGPTRRDGQSRAVALARALGRLGDQRCEPALMALLRWNEDDVQVAAAQALAVVGTVAAVDALLPLAEARLESEAVRNAAQGAVQALLSHIGQESAGAVSLAGPTDEQGAVSLVGAAPTHEDE